MNKMLEDIVLTERVRYEQHMLVYTPENGGEPIRIGGVMGAAILCTMLVDTDEGNRREIAIDTDAEQDAWMLRYEREVPGAKVNSAHHKNDFLSEETAWAFFTDQTKDWDEEARKLWKQWQTNWTDFLTHTLKPKREILFWAREVSEQRLEQRGVHPLRKEQEDD